jgi:hypothetical protein
MTNPTRPQGQQAPVIDQLPPDRRTSLPNGASVYVQREAGWFMAVDGVLHPYQPQSGRGRLIAVLVCFGLIIAVIIGIVVYQTIKKGPVDLTGKTDAFTVGVASCEVSGDIGKVGLVVTNKSGTTRSATISVEYRDGSGARIDTDTAYVRNIAPGDTVRTDESTFLDATPAGSVTCEVTEVR